MKHGFNQLFNMFDVFQDMFESKFDHSNFASCHFGETQFPKTKLKRSDNEIQLIANVAGVKKEDIKLEVKGESIIISGKRSNPFDQLDDSSNELKSFSKTIPIEEEVDRDSIKANLEDGILFVTLKIKENAQSVHININ